MSGAEREILMRQGRAADRQALFDRIRALYDDDLTIRDIAQELGLGLRRVQRWVRLIVDRPPKPAQGNHGQFPNRETVEWASKQAVISQLR
jgi:AraC-like DNA-binding protein